MSLSCTLSATQKYSRNLSKSPFLLALSRTGSHHTWVDSLPEPTLHSLDASVGTLLWTWWSNCCSSDLDPSVCGERSLFQHHEFCWIPGPTQQALITEKMSQTLSLPSNSQWELDVVIHQVQTMFRHSLQSAGCHWGKAHYIVSNMRRLYVPGKWWSCSQDLETWEFPAPPTCSFWLESSCCCSGTVFWVWWDRRNLSFWYWKWSCDQDTTTPSCWVLAT